MAKTTPTTKKSTRKTAKKTIPDEKKKSISKQASSSDQITPPEERHANPAVPYFIGFFALFIILTFFVSETGILGKYISKTLLGLFGGGYYYFPFLLIIIAIYWKRSSEKGAIRSKIVLASTNFIFLLIILNTFSAEDPSLYGIKLYEFGQNLNGSGFIGGQIGALFVNMLGEIPTILLSSLTIFVTTVFIFGSTPKATIKAIIKFFKEIDFGVECENDENINDTKDLSKEAAEKPIKSSQKSSLPVISDENNPAQQRFELPNEDNSSKDTPSSQTAERDIVSFKEINREMPWDEPISDPIQISKTEHQRQADIHKEIEIDKEAEINNLNISEPVLEQSEELHLDEHSNKAPYIFPPISFLAQSESDGLTLSDNDIQRTSQKLVETLASFGVKTKILSTSCGPTVTRYELQPESGVRVKSISNLADDISLHLAATSVRIESIPGKAAVGIEIPNRSVSTVRLHDLLDSKTSKENKSKLFVALGMDVAGNPVYLDVAKMPHLLIAGATGMGKSVCINSIIVSLLYRASPDEVKLILMDPKRVELADYNGIPHLLVPVINEPKKAAGTLNWACIEMEKRYSLLQEVEARNLAEYNATVKDDPEREQLPSIIIIIDELADLMMTAPDDVETSICRLAQKARAAGMHLVIGTQRPSVDVITGLIKANIPSRIAFTVASQVDSRTILDIAGAEKLMGRGDMLYYPVGAMKPIRVQGAFVDGKTEVTAITQFIKSAAEVQYNDDVINMIEQEAKLCGVKHSKRDMQNNADSGDEKDDPMILSALEIAFDCGNISTSLLQRRLSLGYARAARIVDKLERRGFIGQFDPATKKRTIQISKEEFLEFKLNTTKKD